MTIRGLNIWGDPRVPNNDGIDVDSSADVLITHTNVSTLDDAICVKSNDREPQQPQQSFPAAAGTMARSACFSNMEHHHAC